MGRGSTFISWEHLSNWEDPYYFEEFALKNLVGFGKSAHILLVIREPRSYLSSVYLQVCLHELRVKKPEYFFLEDGVYSERLDIRKFAIGKFSYNAIIDFYKERFDNITVVKFERVRELNFISELFSIDENQKKSLKEVFNETQINRAFSDRGVKLTFKVSKLLRKIGISLGAERSSEIILDTIRTGRVDKTINKKIEKRVVRRFLKELQWSNFVRERLDRLLPYKKYALDFKNLKQINIEKLQSEYGKLPDEITYSKSQ